MVPVSLAALNTGVCEGVAPMGPEHRFGDSTELVWRADISESSRLGKVSVLYFVLVLLALSPSLLYLCLEFFFLCLMADPTPLLQTDALCAEL
jgi:hypothetical protein